MNRLTYCVGMKTMKLARGALFVGLCGVAALPGAETTQPSLPPGDDSAIPQSVKDEDYEALITNSPFTRSLGVSDSLILTGIAHMENEVFATLLDTQTMESHIVSQRPNLRGWQLVGIGGNADKLQTWTAKIQIEGGEVISVRYQPPPKKTARASSGRSGSSGSSGGNSPPLSSAQLDEAKNAAVNYKEGFNADGYPRQPPPEMVAKLSRLSVSQREDINKQMFGLRNQGLGLDERRKIYENLVDRSGQGRR
jgi:hypothetical protein